MKKINAVLMTVCCTMNILAAFPAYAQNDFNEESFFVVAGTYGKNSDILLEYYYPANMDGTNYAHRKTILPKEKLSDVEYGDILIADGGFETILSESARLTYELSLYDDTDLLKAGNCSDLMEHKSLTVKSSTYDGSSMAGFSCFTYHLDDETGADYYYSVDYYASKTDVNISDAVAGDVIEFAMYNNSAIIPLTKTDDIAEYIAGDYNGDGAFNIIDVVMVKKLLLGKSVNTDALQWQTADLSQNGIIDVFDFCLMKKLLL